MQQDNFLKKAVYIREIETFFLEMFSKGLLNGTVHTCVGQELIPVIISEHLIEGDKIFSNHRGHGHYIADNNCPKQLILELMGNVDGVSKGIGGSQHILTDSFISNGIQGGLAPIAAGYSFAQSLNKTKNISVCYVGDGTLGEGQFYEALTLSRIFKSPSLFVIENNGYAQSTCNKHTLFGDIKKRIEGFDLDYFCSNIWDIEDLDLKTKEAILNTRNGKPTVLEIECYRLNSHSKGDDNRDKNEIEKYMNKDLINLYIKTNSKWYKEFASNIRQEFNEIIENANKKELDTSIIQNQSVINSKINWTDYEYLLHQKDKRINESINTALNEIIKEFEAIMIGEDIIDYSPETPVQYGGAFKVTKGLSDKFPNFVKNTSISEAGMIGFGIGAALCKRPSIVEIMFGDFMTLCVDQIIQQASKIPSMYGKKIDLPLIIRTPMGGRRGYGPTHSQNIEKLFLFWPNIEVIALNCLTDINKTYLAAMKNMKTTIVIEDKVSYTSKSIDTPPLGYNILETDEQFVSYKLEPEFSIPNLIIVTYGAMLQELLEVLPSLINEEIFPLIISPTRLSPLNIEIFKDIEFNKKPCLFIEEGSKRTSWSSEVISSLIEKGVTFKKINRISNEHIIPCAKDAEDIISPSRLNLAKLVIENI